MTSGNRVFPKTDMIKKMSIKRRNTLKSESTDIMIVLSKDWSDSYLPASLRIRVTLNTRKTLAS